MLQRTADSESRCGIEYWLGGTEVGVKNEQDKKLGYVIMGLVLGIPLAIGLLSFIIGLIVSIFVN